LSLETELSMVERRRTPGNPFCTNMSAGKIITELMVTELGRICNKLSTKMVYENIKESLRMNHLLETRLDAQLS
jgi:hypothetical protein